MSFLLKEAYFRFSNLSRPDSLVMCWLSKNREVTWNKEKYHVTMYIKNSNNKTSKSTTTQKQQVFKPQHHNIWNFTKI